jgi:hypothetical protein
MCIIHKKRIKINKVSFLEDVCFAIISQSKTVQAYLGGSDFSNVFVNILCQYVNAAGVEADRAVEDAPPTAEAAVEAATRMLEAARLSLVHPHWLTLQLEVRPFISFR